MDDNDEISINQQKMYQNELDGVMQYPPSRFLKPSWSGDKMHIKLEEENKHTNEEPNYYEDSFINNYDSSKTNDEYNNRIDCKYNIIIF